MFISNFEKNGIQNSINSLQKQISALATQISDLAGEVKTLKNRKPAKIAKPKKTKIKTPLVRTAEAPWGLKLDGSPRNKPGRAKKVTKVGQP